MSHLKNWLLLFILAVIPCFAHGQIGPAPGGPPSGPAGGCLTGTYPSPGLSTPCLEAGTLPSAAAAGQGLKSTASGSSSYVATDVASPVLNASAADVTGSDIGARANTLFAQLVAANQFGTVTIDPTAATNGTYAQTTTIAIPQGDILDCQGSILSWAAQTLGGPITYGSASQANTPGGIVNCNLLGTTNPTSGDLSIGFYAGGDPNNVLTPQNNYGSYFLIQNSTITGFGTGFTHGTNTWAGNISGSYLNNNYNNILSSTTAATNQGEATKVTNSNIFDAVNCGYKLQYAGDAYYMIGGHLDFNQGGAVCGTWADIQIVNVWIESYFAPAISIINTGVQDYISVTGGHTVLDATPLTITTVAVSASNVLTITATGASSFPNGYWVGHPLWFHGLTTATFLNNTTGIIQTVSYAGGVTTITLAYTHATYTVAADTGTVAQYSADLYHMEGDPGSTLLVTGNHQIINTAQQFTVGIVPANIGLGATTQSTTCAKDNIGPQTYVNGTYLRGCQFQAGLAIQHGSTLATVDVTGAAPLIAFQGYAINWSSFGTGDMDFTNVHGSATGGFYWCDVAANTEPSLPCQMHLDPSGNLTIQGALIQSGGITGLRYANGSSADTVATTAQVQSAIGSSVYAPYTGSTVYAPLASPALTGTPTAPTATAGTNTTQVATTANVVASIPANTSAFTNAQTAPAFYPQTKAAGAYVNFFDDFFENASANGWVTAAIGSGTGEGCSSVAPLDVNHPGVVVATSGTGTSGTGTACESNSQRQIFTPYNSQWTWETVVQPSVLPGTTAGAYQTGISAASSGGIAVSPWTAGMGFYMSSANSNKNNWYCMYNTTYTDSTVTATLAWYRLTMVNNGTNLLWYVNGTQVCSVAVGSLPTGNGSLAWTAVNLNGSTTDNLYVDYVLFQQNVTR